MVMVASGSSIGHKFIKTLVMNRKFIILMLFFLALYYMSACYPLAQSQSGDEELEDWPRSGTRDVRLFIQPDKLTAIISPNICDGRQPFLLVVVCSAVQNAQARITIRETWASNLIGTKESNKNTIFLSTDVVVVFLLGETYNSSSQINVEDESRKFGDIVQESFIDTYNNLTVKSVMLLKWVTQRCSSALYVMKTDDDSFVNLQSLQTLLRAHQTSLDRPRERKSPLLVGDLICGARPILDPTNKWYVPSYIFAGRTYPNYLSGSGYVMSQETVQALYKAAQSVPLIPLEDVYITGQCAAYAGITPEGHPGFSYGKRPMSACALADTQVITSHGLCPNELREAWYLSHASTVHCNKGWFR